MQGNTVCHLNDANLKLHSTGNDWLVITGPKAIYHGVGTINCEGSYGFMISAIDAKLTPSTGVDLIRIRICDKDAGDAILFDNPLGAEVDEDPTIALGGSSIVVHMSK